tara:strand:- start:1389 stop:1781 length:393 start_codon:yes stop_codon:yes gene_type:complete
MIDFITQNKGLAIVAVIILLIFNNRDKLSGVWSWLAKIFSFKWLSIGGKTKTASPDDRKDLYECLIQLQDYLAVCGVDRRQMDQMTLAQVGELTVSAVTPLKPSLEEENKQELAIEINKNIPAPNSQIPV